jgi:hypothetical protein
MFKFVAGCSLPDRLIGEIKTGREDSHYAQRSGRCPIRSLTGQIKVLLDENCFVSARSIAETLQVPYSTVLRHLHEDLGFESFHLRWVPHLLTQELKEQQHTYATEMISVLLSAQKIVGIISSPGTNPGSFSHIRHVGCGCSREIMLHPNHDGRFGRRNSWL